MVLKTLSPGCGVRASLMLFYWIVGVWEEVSILKRSKTKRIKTFYCVNTSYPKDKYYTGQCDRSSQMTEKAILCYPPAGPVG